MPIEDLQTDKIALGYLPTYRALATLIGPEGIIAEIGVHKGESLKLWQALFHEGVVVGVDYDHTCVWPAGTMKIVAQQTDPELPAIMRDAVGGGYDLIVEDASHEGLASKITWELLWPLIKPGGWYVLEDWQVGFPSWADRGPGPYRPSMFDTVVSFLQTLQVPNGEVDSITYRYGQVILKKRG